MKKILLTGASGFIGTNLIEALKDAGFSSILNLDISPPINEAQKSFWKCCDIMDATGFERFLLDFNPTHVVHLAARTDCDENTTVEEGYRVNTEGTANVLNAIKKSSDVERVIITSTQFVFNKGPVLPAGDEDYAPKTVYGQSKIISEQLTREAALSSCWTIIRPTNVWGPWHLRHAEQFFRILKWGLYFHPGHEPVIRSYAYVGNVVDQILKIFEMEKEKVRGKIFYVGDAPINIYDWVNLFSQNVRGKSVRVIPRSYVKFLGRCGDLISKTTGRTFFITSSRFVSMTSDYLTPMDKTFEVLGEPPHTMEDGVCKTAEWLSNYRQIIYEE